MKNGIITVSCVVLLSLGIAMTATAGTVVDTDSDGVPDSFDNCVFTPNGPLAQTGFCNSQEDADANGSGNPCDGDLDGNGIVDGRDFTRFFLLLYHIFPPLSNAGDLDCSGMTDGIDFTLFFSRLFKVPGSP
ncbi:MAG: thrombospondin type 3 repeat-containing protein [Deltaproteobacteria bacterium]|nr:thrombospondin type 3 repeat-containing protein [Deltaproteobacteria bacterium]